MARCMSAAVASATSPMTSSVAGFTTGNVPASPPTSLPSTSIRGSCATSGTGLPLLATQRARPREAERAAGDALQDPARQQAAADQQQAGVDPDAMAGERAPLVERPRHRRCEPLGAAREADEPAPVGLQRSVQRT